jgi:choline dehydrogenase-like flavoprotein
VIDHGTTVGIEVADGPGVTRISARREVVLCAGAFGSSKLLMLSGTGPADELRRHGIPVAADVAQVGRNLQNHPGVDVQWAADHSDSLTAAIRVIGRTRLAAEWGLLRSGLGATNFFEAGAFLSTNDQVAFPDMQYEFLALTRRLVNGRLVPVPGFQFWMDLSRPHSRGCVTLRSADPAAPPHGVRTLADAARVVIERSATVVNLGHSKLGGTSVAVQAAHVATAAGLGLMVGGVIELGVANAMGLHLAAALPQLAYPAYLMGPVKYRQQLTTTQVEVVDSHVAVPPGAGLGVEVDEAELRRLDARRQ